LRRLVEIYLKNTPAVPDVTKGSRIAAVDLARTAAIVGMLLSRANLVDLSTRQFVVLL
jgi:hypothetical protein